MKIKYKIFFFLLLFLLNSCTNIFENKVNIKLTNSYEIIRNELQNNKNKWDLLNISNYQFTLLIGPPSFFCNFPAYIRVKNNEIFDIRCTNTNNQITFDRIHYNMFYSTIPDLFNNKNAFKIEVTYDSIYYYPQKFYIDSSSLVTDEEDNYRISEFIIITNWD